MLNPPTSTTALLPKTGMQTASSTNHEAQTPAVTTPHELMNESCTPQHDSNNHYRRLFESLDDGFCVIEKVAGSADAPLDFIYIEANPAFVLQAGLSDTTAVVGKTIRQLFPTISEDWYQSYDAVHSTGEPVRFERELIPRERWLEVSAFAVADGCNRQLGIIFKDITQRVLTEESRRETEAFNSSIIASSPDCIKILDLEGRVLSFVSGQHLLDMGDAQLLLNRSWIDFWKNDDRLIARQAITDALFGGEGHFVGALQTSSGKTKWWDVAISPILDKGGKPARLLTVSREITQRQQAEINLKFLAEISQDLVTWNTVDGMMSAIGEKLALHLQLSICAFAEVNEIAEEVVVRHEWHAQGAPSLLNTYRMADFVGEKFMRAGRAGTAIVVNNVANSLYTDPAQFAALKIASFICLPLIRDGLWCFTLSLYKSEIYDWREDEITLAQELTTRLWTRLERLRAEAALAESEERFRALVTASSDVVYRMSADWRELRQLRGQNFLVDADAPNDNWLQEYLDPDDQLGVMTAIHEAIRTKSLFEMEHRVRLVDGSLGWTRSQAIPLLDTKGEIIEWFGTAKDVTQYKRAEQALRESEDRYRNLFNSMDEGYCIAEVIFDAHGKPIDYRFVEVNPSFETLTGMHNAQGKRMREFVPDLEDFWFEVYGKVALTGTAVRFVSEAKSMNRWFDVYAFRLGSTQSAKVAILFTNITERKKAEIKLQKSEARFRALFDWGPIAMYACDINGIIQEYNHGAVKIWGSTPQLGDTDEKFRGSFKTFLPDGTFVPYARSAMTQVLRSQSAEMHDMEVILERPDASRITVVVNVVPLKDDQGQVTGAITCFYDVTERSRLERKTLEQTSALADLDRRKDEFLAMLSHELRNPLAPISNAVRMLRLQKNEDPVQLQARMVIERQVGQLNHLIDELLEISRITTGRVQLRKVQIAISGIVDRAVETTQPMMTQRRHELHVSLPPEPIWLHADVARLEQVLVNLLTNAAKYTDEGGCIALNVWQEDGRVVLSVKDNGIGITSKLLPHIFDLFTQADRSLDRSQGGLGIGLCLVKRLVELHGGSVTAQSVLGRGSDFVVRLPVSAASFPSLPIPPMETIRSNGKFCRVLVVDDNVDAAQSLADLLLVSGHEVQMAHEGLSAVEAALAWCPDVVLLDIGLPGINGFEVATRIRNEPKLKTIVLVALTGYGQATDRQRSQDAGFDYHLVKPADFDDVEKILAGVAPTSK